MFDSNIRGISMATTKNLGRIRQVYKGTWSDSLDYEFLDTVYYQGTSYVCISTTGVVAGTALTNTTGWQVLAMKGETGATGDKGDKGDKGDSGAPFSIYKTYPSIADMTLDLANVPEGSFVVIASTIDQEENAQLYVKGDGVFTFIVDMSGLDGIKGDKGEDGADGVTPTVSIGTVTTGASGTPAAVTNTGTATGAVFNFTIPKGDKGDTGAAMTDATVDDNGHLIVTIA